MQRVIARCRLCEIGLRYRCPSKPGNSFGDPDRSSVPNQALDKQLRIGRSEKI